MSKTVCSGTASLAMAYVSWQTWCELYDEKTALMRGTAFPSLDLPFRGRRACE
ncbi:MAG: spore coat associated protein CotJA [Eubacteriales bacterium]|nr:spore coat associated protein CotJA [Eubacteriales bacterium]MDD3880927.1 spore coat associated protein CotJA [Eubacteriales bacterium]MDD4511706.1 spore coat associated protein CotJA [Eubacteriales bacterium]